MNTPEPAPPTPDPPPRVVVPEPAPANPPQAKPTTHAEPDGSGCAILAIFFWVMLNGLLLGFAAVLSPAARGDLFRSPGISGALWWMALILTTIAALCLGWWGERAWMRSELERGSSRTAVMGCGSLIAIVVAVYLFLRTVC